MDCFRKRWLNCKSFVPLFGPRHRPVPWRPCEDTWSGAFHCHGLPRKNDHFHVSSWQKVEVIIQWSSAFHLEDWKASIARQLGHLFFCPELDKAPNAARHKHWKRDPIIPTQSVLASRKPTDCSTPELQNLLHWGPWERANPTTLGHRIKPWTSQLPINLHHISISFP